ncbi:MAG: nucleoside hydrolase [Ilumatobacter sp.]|uniref:nucleoside hydrolase n=2 Tax=Ilumatobacter sp. TaxID=1967498 RepID=UPI003299D612
MTSCTSGDPSDAVGDTADTSNAVVGDPVVDREAEVTPTTTPDPSPTRETEPSTDATPPPVATARPVSDTAVTDTATTGTATGTATTGTGTTDAGSPAGDPVCSAQTDLLPENDEPVRVILDTDFAPDVDDAGALGVLHALADAGEVEILAVMVSDGGDARSDRAIDAINTFYGRPDIPIGVVAGAAPAGASVYVDELAAGFPNDVQETSSATDLYRRILSGQPDASVTILSIGYLTNLEALLSSSPDAASASPGDRLVEQKVVRWVAMGGTYPDSIAHPLGAEFNFERDVTAAINSVADWPTPAVFAGWELGDVVLTGAVLQTDTPPENPVREAYRLFNGGQAHRSWDLIATLAAVRGTAGLFDVCTGRNVIGRGGSNRWENDGENRHGYLRLTVPAADVAAVLDGLLVEPPGASP